MSFKKGFRESTVLALLILVGKEFHNLGAGVVNERSPSVRYDLHTGVLSRSSLVERKLYLVPLDGLIAIKLRM